MIITHPEICGKGEKEKHYFDKDMTKEDTKNYLKEFDDCKEEQYLIDSTPRYIAVDLVPIRISLSYTSGDLMKKKFILILREPIGRHYSEYQFRVRLCTDIFDEDVGPDDDEYKAIRGDRNCVRVTHNYKHGIKLQDLKIMTFAEWVDSPDGSHELQRGHYIEHINEWLKIIRREQLFIINFQSLIEDTTNVMNSLSTFLGLKKGWGPEAALPVPSRQKPTTFLDCATFDRLSKHYSKMNKELVRFINSGREGKPVSEPVFIPFDSSKSSCLKDDPNVDDDEVKRLDDEAESEDDKA